MSESARPQAPASAPAFSVGGVLDWVEWVLKRTLGSVVFGIVTMVLLAAYVAVGSGFPSVAHSLEMDEMQFFNAWPMRLLAGLLVCNLAVVTFTRIPFTAPRYGVWTVHAGIFVLVTGMVAHYALKTEGLVFLTEGATSDRFYHVNERSLYLRAGVQFAQPIALPTLPRFNEYPDEQSMGRRAVRGLSPQFASLDPQIGGLTRRSLGESIGVPDLQIDVVGFYPYAEIETDGYDVDPAIDNPGFKLEAEGRAEWLVAGDAGKHSLRFENVLVEHRHLRSRESLDRLIELAPRVHQLSVRVGERSQDLVVEPGRRYELGDLGYNLEVLAFDPAWQTIDGRTVRSLFVRVEPRGDDARPFVRQLLAEESLQTDFDPSVEDAGPLGRRMPDPIDRELKLFYRFDDPVASVAPRAVRRYLLVTLQGDDRTGLLVSGLAEPVRWRWIENVSFELPVSFPASGGPLAPVQPTQEITFRVTRENHLAARLVVRPVPLDQQQREMQRGRLKQVALARVRSGDWSRVVPVPFIQFAGATGIWEGHSLVVPGATEPITMVLSNTAYPLPAQIRLDRFELVPYPGGEAGFGSIMRDFRSHLTITDREGRQLRDIAQMNSPVYYQSGQWLFFQAQWGEFPDGSRYSVLGVGNRPGVTVMILGSVLIGVGLLYAFYVKPIILNRMKRNALRRAAELRQSRQPPGESTGPLRGTPA